MSKLFINDSGNQVQVAELGLIAGKQQMIVGDLERDFIIRTSGNVQIQVGNKFYPLTYNSANITGGSNVVITSNTTIVATEELLAALDYPGDGNYVYVEETKAFYIANNGTYVRLNPATTPSGESIVYLSYNTAQDLDGTQKLRLALNTGSYVNKISDVQSYDLNEIYVGQILYSIEDGNHYVLTDALSPNLVESWQPLYLSLLKGGTVKGPVTLDSSRFHIEGQAAITDAHNITTGPIFTVGKQDNSSGLAVWSNGNTYIQNLVPNSNQGIRFLATNSTGLVFNPLSVLPEAVSLFGSPDFDYKLTVNGTSKFNDTIYPIDGLRSPDYQTGPTGVGFTLTQDPLDNKWLLEVDKLLVRQEQEAEEAFQAKSINGSFWSNPAIIVSNAQYIDNYDVYILASQAGNYSDTSGTVIPLSSKGSYALVDGPTVITEGGSPRTVTNKYIGFGIGDRDGSGTTTGLTTYVKDLDDDYVSVVPTHKYASGVFTEDPTGTYVQSQSINLFYIETGSLNMLEEGDLLYYADWNADTSEDTVIAAIVVDVTDSGAYVEVYNSTSIVKDQKLIIVGKTASNNSIHFNGIDNNGDYIESLKNVDNFRDLFENFYYSPENYEVLPINTYKPLTANTSAKLGALDNLIDEDLDLTGTVQTGLYSDNAYLKGKFVVNKGIYNNIPLETEYNPFIMLNSDNMLEKVDLSDEIASWDVVANGKSNRYLKNQPIQYFNKTITFFGDSYTYGNKASTPAKRWTSLMSAALGATEVNYGVNGTTLQKRTPIDYLASPNMIDNISVIPTKDSTKALLVIAYGLNDLGCNGGQYSPANYKIDYRTILDAALAKNWSPKNILIIPAYYIGSAGYAAYSILSGNPPPTVEQHLAYIEAAKEIAEEYGTLCVDIYDAQVRNDTTLIDPDGIHANDAGNEFIANHIGNYLAFKSIKTGNTHIVNNRGLYLDGATEADNVYISNYLGNANVFRNNNGGITSIIADNDGNGAGGASAGTGHGLEFKFGTFGILGGIYHQYDGTAWWLRFKAYSGSASTERLTIKGSNGYVGINNTNPGVELDVTGSVRSTLLISNTFTSGAITKFSANGTITAATLGTDYITRASLSATSPLFYNNTTGVFSTQIANSIQNGVISSTDWNTFNNKQALLVSGTNIKTINGTSILGSGDLTITVSGTTTNPVTFNNSGSGAASGTTFDGSVARTISYNTIGAQVAGSYEAPLTFSGGLVRTTNNIAPTYGTGSNTFAQGNDSRINNGQTAFGWGNHAGLYPTYTGSGASGTWGISISGNAATASNSSALNGQAASYYTDIVSRLGYTPYNSSNPSGFITGAYTGFDSRYQPLENQRLSTSNSVEFAKVAVTYGGVQDQMGPMGVTMPGDGNVYAFIGLTRRSNLALALGMDTTNNFCIGTGATGGPGTTMSSPWKVNPINGDQITSGSITSAASYQTSQRHLKTDIEPYTGDALSYINSLTVQSFRFKSNLKEQQIGFIVDEVEQVNEEILNKDRTSINKDNLIAQLTKAVQELTKQVKELQK